MTVGLLPRLWRDPEEGRIRDLVQGSRTVAERLETVADRLDEAVTRLADEIADPNDHPDDREGQQ